MAQVQCYDPDGNMHMKEPVDLRECIQNCGYTTSPPKEVPVAPTVDPSAAMLAENQARIAADEAAKAAADEAAKAAADEAAKAAAQTLPVPSETAKPWVK